MKKTKVIMIAEELYKLTKCDIFKDLVDNVLTKKNMTAKRRELLLKGTVLTNEIVKSTSNVTYIVNASSDSANYLSAGIINKAATSLKDKKVLKLLEVTSFVCTKKSILCVIRKHPSAKLYICNLKKEFNLTDRKISKVVEETAIKDLDYFLRMLRHKLLKEVEKPNEFFLPEFIMYFKGCKYLKFKRGKKQEVIDFLKENNLLQTYLEFVNN